MLFSRDTESILRDVLDVLELADTRDFDAVLARLEHLRRALAPEYEFALILSWLGKCRLVHRLGQEQLPLMSTDEYRVPDLLAVFDRGDRTLPVLIEVKTTEPSDPTTLEPGTLSLKPHYRRYADALGIPMLVAWRHRGIWALFDIREAKLAVTNYSINFFTAIQNNLLGVLAGDFSYRLAPGTAIRLPIRKLTEPDPITGGFEGVIHDPHFMNPAGERIPNIPHLMTLFMIWENEVEISHEGLDVVQSFVVPDIEYVEFASRTLTRLVYALARIEKSIVNWRSIIHDVGHIAHDVGRLRKLVELGAEHGVISPVIDQIPRRTPDFLAARHAST